MAPTSPLSSSSPHGLYDLTIIGGGASGMVAAISAARRGRRTLICEKSPSLGRKLLASGGQRCNLSNTLSTDEFMERVGRDGRFMGPALEQLGGPKLREFFHGIGVKTVVHDGFRVWPETRKSSTVLEGLEQELKRLEVEVAFGCAVSTHGLPGERVSNQPRRRRDSFTRALDRNWWSGTPQVRGSRRWLRFRGELWASQHSTIPSRSPAAQR